MTLYIKYHMNVDDLDIIQYVFIVKYFIYFIIANQSEIHRGYTFNKPKTQNPIILVPNTASTGALVTQLNIKNLLENGWYLFPFFFLKYIHSWENPKTLIDTGIKKDSSTSKIKRHVRRKIIDYDVVDNIAKLSHSDWERVICIFLSSAPWQFNGWPWNSPIDILTKSN